MRCQNWAIKVEKYMGENRRPESSIGRPFQCHGNNAPEMELLLVSGKIDLQDISEMHPV